MSHSQRIQGLAGELEDLRATLRQALEQGGERQGEALALVKVCRGVSMAAWLEAARQNDPGGLAEFLPMPLKSDLHPHLVRFMDVLESYAQKLRVDPSTGLANAAAFEALFDLEIERALRNRHSLSLARLRLEMDGSSESFVASLAELFSRRIRRYDVAARIGPVDFALLFPGSGMHRMRLLMDRLLAETDKLADASGLSRGMVRAGLASIKGKQRITPQDFRNLAEEALAQAGKDGPITAAAIPDIATTPPGSLVQSYEKLFLFTGR